MKINIQKIAYRAIPVLTAFVVLISCVAVPAMAETVNGRTIIDYNDYVSRVVVDGENDIVTISLPPYMYGVQADDDNGYRYLEAVDLGSLVFEHSASAGVYFPGSVITNTYLDLKNIPDGSVFTNTGTAWLEVNDLADGVMEGYYYTAVEYFDDRFLSVGSQSSSRQNFIMTNGADRIDLTWNFTVKAPQGARYCVTIFMFHIYNTIPKTTEHVLWYDFAIPQLQMSINSLYRLQEQTGKTNELLQNLIDGTPGQNAAVGGAVDDMQNAAGELEDMGDQLAGVEKPNLDNTDISWDAAVPYAAMMAYVAPINALWESPTLLGMLTIVLTLVLISWVFFGKKV